MSDNITGNPTGYTPPAHAIEGSLTGTGKKIGIICAKFNERITKSLLMGAITGLTEHGVSESNIVTHWVPGAFEVPVVAETIFPKYDAIIAIACVIKGDTPHFDYVCDAITQGMTLANANHKKPGIFCVLTTNTKAQADERSKPNCTSNKGYEAALTALEMINLLSDATAAH
ncbi:MAG: 6,7-dimethyl-8-ribityllumazine synthase [Candidatus Marinamargulisbacteria bacterium]